MCTCRKTNYVLILLIEKLDKKDQLQLPKYPTINHSFKIFKYIFYVVIPCLPMSSMFLLINGLDSSASQHFYQDKSKIGVLK